MRGLRDDGFNFHCQVGVKFSVRRMRKEGDKGGKQKKADKDSSGLPGQGGGGGWQGWRLSCHGNCLQLELALSSLYSAAGVREQTGRESYVPGFIKS